MTTTKLGLPEITQSQGDKYVTHNDALRDLDALVQPTAISVNDSTPPGGPSEGDVYVVAAGSPSATGAWAGQEGDVAVYQSGAWDFFTPLEGWIIYAQDEDIEYRFDGSEWVAIPSENIDTFTELTDTPSSYALQGYKGVRVNSGETATEFYDTELLRAINTTYSGLDIVASGIYPVLDWRKTIHASYMDEDVPSGSFIGSYASESAATTAGGSAGDWYYDTVDQNFYELLSGSPSRQQIYRAGSARMPALIGVVAATSRVIIFDTAKSRPEMWMEFVKGTDVLLDTGTALTDLSFAGPRLCVGTSNGGVFTVDFADDKARRQRNNTANTGTFNGVISQRNEAVDYTYEDADVIVNGVVNAVATYLSGSGATNQSGVEIPYVAAFTDTASGRNASVILPDGTVYDVGTAANSVDGDIDQDGRLVIVDANGDVTFFDDITAINADGFAASATLDETTSPALGTSGNLITTAAEDSFGSADGLFLLDYANDLVAAIRSGGTTGWMKGVIQGAWGGETDTSDLVGGSPSVFLTDLSGNGNDLEVFGTLTRAAVATGAELAEISGFSASNYLESAAGADGVSTTYLFDEWVNITAGADEQTIFHRVDPASGTPLTDADQIRCYVKSDETIGVDLAAAGEVLVSSSSYTGRHRVAVRHTGANIQLVIDGVQVDSAADTTDLTDAAATIRYGLRQDDTKPFLGSMCLMRASLTDTTDADESRIYLDEKKLFSENAACTISGSSDAVISLAYDKIRNRYHAATTDGTSVFAGLNRVDTLTGDDAVSVHDDASIGNVAGDTQIDKPAISTRELLAELRG